jgi:FSR family fosmidomycin resistance protein-like MFS transporter
VNAPVQSGSVVERDADGTVFAVLVAISVSHMLNDTIQSLLMGIYPVLKDSFALDYTQIGLLSFTFLVTASVLQPVIGIATDRRPMPYSLPLGMAASLAGLILLSVAPSFAALLAAAALIGLGSAVFHPEASRVARLASGGRFGVAQSIFQVGGNVGTAIGPLLAAAIVVPYGQSSIAWFSILALIALVVLFRVGNWYKRTHFTATRKPAHRATIEGVSRGRLIAALAVLMALIFSKFFYLESFRSYYTFYLIEKFGVDIQTAQVLLFVQLFAIVVGTLIGGPIGDRIGRKYVIWASILGILPLTLILPHVGLAATVFLTIPIGIGLASAFPAIVVFAQELLPGRTGMVSGLFFGLAFGMGGIGAAVLGNLADRTSIEFVYQASAFLPAIGLLTVFLPNIDGRRGQAFRKSAKASL